MNVEHRINSSSSIHEHELIAVEEHSNGVWPTVLCRVISYQLGLARSRGATQDQFVSGRDASAWVGRLPFESRGDVLALTDDELIVQRRQRLQCRDRRAPYWRQLRRIRTVERLHERVGERAEYEPVHAAAIILG